LTWRASPDHNRSIQKAQKEFRIDPRELRAMQKRTEATLERFIRSMERGTGNGPVKSVFIER
jgi:hypothetical protein